MKHGWLNLIILVNVFGLLIFYSQINAAFSTFVTSPNNLLQFGTLDLNLAPSPLFTLTDFKPGNTDPQTLTIKNQGSLDFQYNFEFQKISGSDSLCQALELKAQLNSTTYYNGSLDSFTLSTTQTASSNSQDDWVITISLNQTSETLQSSTCNFNLKATAFQTTSNGA